MNRLRIYADTSVFGGCYDEEFASDSLALFDEISAGRFVLVISTTTLREIRRAPDNVRNVLNGIQTDLVQVIELSKEIEALRDAYLDAGVVGRASRWDAEHIACASVGHVDLIVSWNFKHIVHYDKIRHYHAVNLVQGYPCVPIHSPKEVVSREE